MTTFRHFVETKNENSTRKIPAVEDMAKALVKVFAKYSRHTREDAWEQLTSVKGKKEVDKLLINPSRSLAQIRKLAL